MVQCTILQQNGILYSNIPALGRFTISEQLIIITDDLIEVFYTLEKMY